LRARSRSQERQVEEETNLPAELASAKKIFAPETAVSLDDDLSNASAEVKAKMERSQRKLLQSLNMEEYVVGGSDADWDQALKGAKKGAVPGSVSVKATAKVAAKAKALAKGKEGREGGGKGKGKGKGKGGGEKKGKKRKSGM
jgi:hypothetical protein